MRETQLREATPRKVNKAEKEKYIKCHMQEDWTLCK